jgi:glycosyltransferase involved in cell wall biosynthesis
LSKDTFGTDIWAGTIKAVNPDVIIVYNDMPVTCALLNKMLDSPKTCPFISYIDIIYPFQKSELVYHIAKYSDHMFVFSEVWKKHLVECFEIPSRNVSIFSHGIDKFKFNKISKIDAKRKIGVREDGFMIFNMNRNSYRKLLDITIKAFVRFWKLTGCDEKVSLVLNCRTDIDTGYNFKDIVRLACVLENVDHHTLLNNNIKFLSATICGNVSDEYINAALNASDIGMNTCGGEGFGLCNAEGAYLGVPQVVTNTGGLSDIFRGFDNMLVEPKVCMSLTAGIDFHNGELAICDYKDFADKLLYYYNNRNILEADGVGIERRVRWKYDWDTLFENFSCDIDNIMSRSKIPNVPCFYITNDGELNSNGGVYTATGLNIIKIRGDYDDLSSHAKVMRNAFEKNCAITLISRDTTAFTREFIKKLIDTVSKLPMNWHFLRLESEPGMFPSCYAISRGGLFTVHRNNYVISLKDLF